MPDIDCMTVNKVSDGMKRSLRATYLTTEGRREYAGCDEKNPRLGWRITGEGNGLMQTAYRIVVCSDRDKADNLCADVWDSGKVESDKSQLVDYAGAALLPEREYYWRVKIWDEDGQESPWSDIGVWSTGIMDPSGARAMWIGCDTLAPGDRQDRHSRLRGRYLRKEFTLAKKLRRATAHICGLGYYRLDINGSKVGDDVLTPAPTDFTKNVIYNTYDVTDRMCDRNAICVTLAPGYYYAMAQNFQTNVRTTYGFPKLWMKLTLEYADGSVGSIVSDGSWRLSVDGPLRYANIYDGEMYDATKAAPGVFEPGFDDSAWRMACEVEAPGGTLVGNLTPPVGVRRVERPLRMKRTARGWLVDFGTNGAGQIRFTECGAPGDTVVIRYAELTQPGDTLLDRENLRSAECTDRYVCSGERRTWNPEFTWQGFRYAEISPAEAVDTASIRRLIVHDRMEEYGDDMEFLTSEPTVLAYILENARRGIMSNYKGMPVDCPQRDERMPWLGDRATGALGESYVADNRHLYAKWVRDIKESQRSHGALSDVAPAYWRLYNPNVTWPAALPMICDMLYRQYGDIRPMSDSYDAIGRWLEYVRKASMKDGLLTYDRYGDWCLPPESPELIHSADSTRITDGRLIASCCYYYLCRMMERYAPLVGRNAEGCRYGLLASEVKEAVNREFLHEGVYGNSTVTSNLLPLAMEMVPDSCRRSVVKAMTDRIEAGGCRIDVGVIGIQWLMRTLATCGRNDIAWKIATSEAYPGWGYMVGKGATTVWELWNGDTADRAMNSGNHVMLLGDLLPWCYEIIGGITPDKPGFKSVRLSPAFDVAGLDGMTASHMTPYGLVYSKWERRGREIHWVVRLPGNCSGMAYFPDGTSVAVEAGISRFTFPDMEI